MRGWMGLLGLAALVALLTPGMWELTLADKLMKKIKRFGKENPQ